MDGYISSKNVLAKKRALQYRLVRGVMIVRYTLNNGFS